MQRLAAVEFPAFNWHRFSFLTFPSFFVDFVLGFANDSQSIPQKMKRRHSMMRQKKFRGGGGGKCRNRARFLRGNRAASVGKA